MRSFLRGFRSDQEGVVAAIFAIFLFVLVGFAALAVDMSYTFSTRTNLQATASAAAHAGVLVLTGTSADEHVPTDAFRLVAVEYAYRNMTDSAHGNILHPDCGTYSGTPVTDGDTDLCDDVQAGNWNPDDREFCAWDNRPPYDCYVPDDMALNAVRVDAYRSVNRGNPLNLFLAPAIGLAETSIYVHAIAWGPVTGGVPAGLDCFQTGLLAMGQVDLDSNNWLTEGVCVYGDEGIKIQSDLCFEGVAVPDAEPPILPTTCPSSNGEPTQQVLLMTPAESGPDAPQLPYWDQQGSNNAGWYEAQTTGSLEPELANLVPDYIDAAEAGFTDGTWTKYDQGVVSSGDPNGTGPNISCVSCPATSMGSSGPAIGTMYELSGEAVIPEGEFFDFAIRADSITVKPGAYVHNAILVGGKIKIEGTIRNVIIAQTDSGQDVDIASDSSSENSANSSLGEHIGDLIADGEERCGPTTVAIYGRGSLKIQSDVKIKNTQLVTLLGLNQDSVNSIDLQSNNIYDNVTMQSWGPILLGTDNKLYGCPNDGAGGTGNIPPVAGAPYVRLVD